MSTNPQSTDSFWLLVARMYKIMDHIKVSTQRIHDLTFNLQNYMNEKKELESFNYDIDFEITPAKKILTEIKKEFDSILSYAHELSPHLKNPNFVTGLSNYAHMVLLEMEWPDDRFLYQQLKMICLGCDVFAQDANKLQLNPTKKSMKIAFGIDVHIESAKLKAYLEKFESNF